MDSYHANKRILSGMRPTGNLHLGHYHGVIKNWAELQHEYECFFCVVDWHALTTHYDNVEIIGQSVWDVVSDWLACGIDPELSHIFIQSKVPEHAELHLLLSMITPNSWLERMPTYKDQQDKLKDKDLATYGFLGYPLLQSADILAYRAGCVPVGDDQLPHIEFTREIARRFNHLYGLTPDFETDSENILMKLPEKIVSQMDRYRRQYLQSGNAEAMNKALALLEHQQQLNSDEKQHLQGYIEGTGKIILPEPQSLVTKASCLPGLDGQKMSKSYNNTVSLRDKPEVVEKKIKTMPTDPARVKRTDPGDPDKCPVWKLHQVYSDTELKDWVQKGCKTANIGCIDCKKPIIDAINNELAPIQERADFYDNNPAVVKEIVQQGSEAARDEARKTLTEVRNAMGLNYRNNIEHRK